MEGLLWAFGIGVSGCDMRCYDLEGYCAELFEDRFTLDITLDRCECPDAYAIILDKRSSSFCMQGVRAVIYSRTKYYACLYCIYT